ncbi:MAG: DUF1318 domain-containing protein [Candidatus Omnitrophota bacterium]
MKIFSIILTVMIFMIGCARVNVGGAKEPIKLDIAMRLDVYQHVEKDIDAIENIVSGPKDKEQKKPADQQSFLGLGVSIVYAQEELNPQAQQAALRRKDRINEVYALESKGIIGENKIGLLELRDSSQGSASVKQLIELENADRIIICEIVAAKNNVTIDDLNKIYAKRLHDDAPKGAPIETFNEASGVYEWKIK